MALPRLPWLCAAVLLTGALVPACGHADQPETPAPPPPSGPTLRFVEAEPLRLTPGQRVALAVQVEPATSATVRFSLLDDSDEASLDRGSVPVDASGAASVTLQAPRQSRQFRVRASLDGGAQAERTVEVNGTGVVTVRVAPLYAGLRQTPSWTATIEPDAGGCAGLVTSALATAQGALPLVLTPIPTGQPLRVRVRSGEAVEGCTSLTLTPTDEQRTIEVVADNTPLQVPAAPLDLALAVVPDPTAWKAALDRWTTRFTAAFVGGQIGDHAADRALLDTMVIVAPPDRRPALLAARQAQGWDDLAAQYFTGHPGPAMVLQWVGEGVEQLRAAPGAITGQLRTEGVGTVSFTPAEFLVLRTADVVATKLGTWSTSVDDKVQAGGEVSLWPTVLLGRAAELATGLPADGGATALRQQTSCASLATMLGAGPGCAVSCLESLCDQALGVMWGRALGADQNLNASATLAFVASGTATLDGARLTGFEGSWVGTLKDTQSATGSIPFAGSAQATPAP